MHSRLKLKEPTARQIDLSRVERANDATVEPVGSGLTVVTPKNAGAFAAALPLPPHGASDPKSVVVELRGKAANNAVGFVFATPDMRRMIGSAISLGPNHKGAVRWLIDGIDEAHWLLVRNDGVDGKAAALKLDSVQIYPAEAEALPPVADLAEGRMGHVDVALMAAVADAVDDPMAALAAPDPIRIDAVPVELLGPRLGFTNAFDPARASRKPLTQWRMEDDDQPVFRYLYREAKPMRHLEFGTWLGAGAVYCLEESDATVWTINLAEGEQLADGRPAYDMGTGTVRTDSGADIGRLYRQAGLGHRVCQIYSDTRHWDTRHYPQGFFDTVLIDGGHQEEIVLNDTAKAVGLLRSGGLCLWHDFAPDPAVFAVSPATIGVAKGIRAAWPIVAETMRDIFYVWPSQILVGIRR